MFLMAVSSETRIGSLSLLSPSSLPCRNTIFFPLLRNQMLIVGSQIAREIAGVERSAKRRDIVSLVSIGGKDAGRLY